MATGGGPPAGGYGRGGRGLAILEALKKEQVGTAFFATPAALLNTRSRTECMTSSNTGAQATSIRKWSWEDQSFVATFAKTSLESYDQNVCCGV